MAIHIRKNENIKGIKVEKITYKICQLADDTTLFVRDMESLEEAILQLQKFSLCSGLKINLEKTEIVPNGTNKNKELKLSKNLSQVMVNNNAFKTLGIWFTSNIKEAVTLNYENRPQAMCTFVNIWSCRNLSFKGKY